MPVNHVTGADELRALAARLKAAGDDGKGLKKALYASMNEAVQPVAQEVGALDHLMAYLPNRYAEVLAADLSVRISKTLYASNPRIEVTAKARQHRRKLAYLNTGFINHPDYPRGPRSTWHWTNGQTGGMHPGFFSDVVDRNAPEIRDKVLAALTETARQVTGNG